jgi:hypothetical protein
MSVAAAVARARSVPRPTRELAAVLATAALHLAWPAEWPRPLFILPVCAAWVGHVVVTVRRDPTALDDWGLRREGFAPTAAAVGALLAVGVPTLLAIGAGTGGLALGWTTALSALLYPAWGLVQQLLVLGMVVGPLSRLPVRGAPALAVAVGAIGFGLAHLTEPWLVPATALLGLTLAPVFLRWRNLWPLAVAHGWLGALVYPTLVHRDPVAEFLAILGG